MKCLIDMDGVLVDFNKGILEQLGIDNPYTNPKNRGVFDLCDILNIPYDTIFKDTEHDFWANLEWTPEGREILETLLDKFGLENCCILSSPTRNLGCMSGKLEWINRHIPEFSRRYLFGTQKHFVAHTNSVLIDDKRSNCVSFRKEGGTAIMIRRDWNTVDKYDTLKTFHSELESFLSARGGKKIVSASP